MTRRRLLAACPLLLCTSALASAADASTIAASGLAATDVTRIDLPAVIDSRPGATIDAQISGETLIAIDSADLAQALTGLARPEIIEALRSRGGADVPVAELANLGVAARFDLSRLAIAIDLSVSSRAAVQVDLSSGSREMSGDPAPAAGFSAGFTAAVTHLRDIGTSDRSATAIEGAGFANLGGKGGYYLLYSGALRLSGEDRQFERGRVIAFKDDLKRVLRYSAGDLLPAVPRLIGDVQLAGFGIDRRYEDLQPLRNVRPTGSRSFVVERPSRIEIYSNGALVRTLDVQPGPVDLRDIPALSLSSNISIIIEDSFGRRELDSFSLGNDLELLAAGLSEFSVAAGVLRNAEFGNLRYSRKPALVGSYARGITNRLTAGGHLAFTSAYQNAGLDLALSAFGGLVVASGSVARSDAGTGGAITLDYRGDPFGQSERNGQFNLRADLRTSGFRTLSTFGIADRTKIELAADYRFDLSEKLSASMGGSLFQRYGEGGASWSAFAGLQANFDRFFVTATGRFARRSDGKSDSGVLLTLSLPIGRNHLLTAAADPAQGVGRAEIRRRRDLDIPEFDYSAAIARDRLGTDLSARSRFAGSRFEVEGSAARLFSREDGSQTRLTLRAQSGIAFADGRFGIGRDPGRGFALVSRHQSLAGTPIDLFSSGTGRRVAQINGFGPGIVSQVAPYRPDTITFNMLDPPIGYDVGAGKYATDTGAYTGHAIEIGTDEYRSALANLTLPDGRPLSLRYGRLQGGKGPATAIFTNGEGRAVLSNLGPGQYEILFEERYRHRFTVPEDAPAVIDLGTIRLEEAP